MEGAQASQQTLDDLILVLGESVSRIAGDPDAAFRRVVARALPTYRAAGLDVDDASLDAAELATLEQQLSVEATPGTGYGSHISGSLLMAEERVLTEDDMRREAEKIMRFSVADGR